MAEGPAPRRPGPRELVPLVVGALLLALLLRGAVAESYLVTSGGMAPTLLPGDHLLVSRLAYGVRLPYTRVTLLELPPPRRGDVVVFRDPSDRARLLVKRVVGLPGDLVEVRDQTVLLDGQPQPRRELGGLSYAEPGEGGAQGQADTCRRWRELLDLRASRPRPPGGPPAATEAEAWAAGQALLAAGEASGHDLLQCRRLRPGRREGPFGPVRPGHLFVLGDNRDRSSDSRAGWEVPLAEVVGRGALVGWSWGPGGWWPWGADGLRVDRLFKPVE